MRDVKEPEIRRAEIMDAAMILFMEKGYTNTTTQDIVDKVNISRGLLYYHFKNKEDILYCLVEQYSDRLLKDIYIIVYDEDKTAIEKIRSFMSQLYLRKMFQQRVQCYKKQLTLKKTNI